MTDHRAEPAAVGAGIAVCLKWVSLRPEVDPLTGVVATDGRFSGFSPADFAALEWALRVSDNDGRPVTAICLGPAEAVDGLRDVVARGASAAVLIESASGHDDGGESAASRWTADALAEACAGASLVFCGDHSLDRGSGSVPAFLADRLGYGQALGCVSLTIDGEVDGLAVERRLDQGRRERLSLVGPTVCSFEGGLEARRAPLTATLAAPDDRISRRPAPTGSPSSLAVTATGPYRPRPRQLSAPQGETVARIRQLIGADEERSTAQQVELEPPEAAAAVIEQLTRWGHLGSAPSGGTPDDERA